MDIMLRAVSTAAVTPYARCSCLRALVLLCEVRWYCYCCYSCCWWCSCLLLFNAAASEAHNKKSPYFVYFFFCYEYIHCSQRRFL